MMKKAQREEEEVRRGRGEGHTQNAVVISDQQIAWGHPLLCESAAVRLSLAHSRASFAPEGLCRSRHCFFSAMRSVRWCSFCVDELGCGDAMRMKHRTPLWENKKSML